MRIMQNILCAVVVMLLLSIAGAIMVDYFPSTKEFGYAIAYNGTGNNTTGGGGKYLPYEQAPQGD